MPPIALGAVARAVRAGCNTMQKIRKRTRDRYSDHQIRRALHALVRSGDITRESRRYRSQRNHHARSATFGEAGPFTNRSGDRHLITLNKRRAT